MVLPDRFIDHAAPAKQYAEAGLDAPHIVATALPRSAGRRSGRGVVPASEGLYVSSIVDP